MSRTCGAAFGLAVESPLRLEWLDGSRPTGPRSVELQLIDDLHPQGEVLVENRSHNGELLTRFSQDASGGYLIEAPGHGSFLVSRDGRQIRCGTGGVAFWAWQRYLIGQALPLSALLQGLEVFHASAVRMRSGAAGFVGGSGAGKSSLAVALSLEGAEFLSDDVVAVETIGERLLVHPGPRVANVRRGSLDGFGNGVVGAATMLLAHDDEVERRLLHGGAEACELKALYYIERDLAHAGPSLERMPSPDPQLLLASTFSFLIDAPVRLERQLDVCARLARTVPIYRLRIPASGRPRDVARWFLDRTDATVEGSV